MDAATSAARAAFFANAKTSVPPALKVLRPAKESGKFELRTDMDRHIAAAKAERAAAAAAAAAAAPNSSARAAEAEDDDTSEADTSESDDAGSAFGFGLDTSGESHDQSSSLSSAF